MNKRGQVTVFIIIGIVLVILAGLFFFLRDYYGVGVPVQTFLQGPKQSIEKNVRECVDSTIVPGLVTLGAQGGYMYPLDFKLYKDKKVTYLCKSPACINNIRPPRFVEEELENYLLGQMLGCVDQSLLKSKRGYEIKDAPLNLDVAFVGSDVQVEVDYPVEISKGGVTERLGKVKQNVEVPFGELYDVAYDIVYAYATEGNFYHLPYMLSKKGAYEIQVDRPYPDVVYMINKKDSSYVFYMAVEG